MGEIDKMVFKRTRSLKLMKPGLSLSCGLVIIVMVVACSSKSNSAEDPKTRWLSKQPCASPCWENIEPGKTLAKDVFGLVQDISIVDTASVHIDNQYDISVIDWSFNSKTSQWNGQTVYINTEESEPIRSLALITPDLCLGEIIKAYGEPDYLFLTAYDAAGIIDLIWRDNGFVYIVQSTPNAPIEATTCGGRVILFPTETPLTQITGIFAEGASDDQFIRWRGYGSY